MSNIIDEITGAVAGTLQTVVVDSALLPGPITIDLSGATTTSSGSSGMLTSLLKPSVTVLDKNGTTVYQSAPWGDPAASRLPFYIAVAAAGFGLSVFGYGLWKMLKG